MIDRERYACQNCLKNTVGQPGWICNTCKSYGYSQPEKAKDNPDYDSQMMQNFVMCSKLIEELPKDQRVRLTKALGCLYGS